MVKLDDEDETGEACSNKIELAGEEDEDEEDVSCNDDDGDEQIEDDEPTLIGVLTSELAAFSIVAVLLLFLIM